MNSSTAMQDCSLLPRELECAEEEVEEVKGSRFAAVNEPQPSIPCLLPEQEIDDFKRIVNAWTPKDSSKDFRDGFLAGLILYPEMRFLLVSWMSTNPPFTHDFIEQRCKSIMSLQE